MDEIQKLREALLTTGKVPPSLASEGLVRAWSLVKNKQDPNSINQFIRVIQNSHNTQGLLAGVKEVFSSEERREQSAQLEGYNLSSQVNIESARSGYSPLDLLGMSSGKRSLFGIKDWNDEKNLPEGSEFSFNNTHSTNRPKQQTTPVTQYTPESYPHLPLYQKRPFDRDRYSVGPGPSREGTYSPDHTPNTDKTTPTNPSNTLEKILEVLLRIEKTGTGSSQPNRQSGKGSEEHEENTSNFFALAVSESGLSLTKILRFLAARGIAHGAKTLGTKIKGWLGGSKPKPVPKTKTTPSTGSGTAASSAAETAAGEEAAEVGGAAVLGEEALAGPPGWVLAGLTLFVGATVEFAKAVYGFARAQEEEIRRQSELGGQQAAGIAELDVGRLQRDIQTARETGASSRMVTDSLNRFEQVWQKISSLLENISNVVSSALLDELTKIVTPIADIASTISTYAKKYLPDPPANPGKDLFGIKIEGRKDIGDMPKWPQGPAGGPVIRRGGFFPPDNIGNPFNQQPP